MRFFVFTSILALAICASSRVLALESVIALESIDLEAPLRDAVAAYAEGEGEPDNFLEQHRIFLEAAEAGNPVAQYYLGHMHLYAKGVPLDPEKAWRYFEMAAKRGVDQAFGRMGYMWFKGIGRDKDLTKAIPLYRIAAQSDIKSMANLAFHIIEGDAVGTEAYAIKAMKRGVEANNIAAINNLGFYHISGRLKNSDPDYGVRLLEKAAELGNPLAARNLYNISFGRYPLVEGSLERFKKFRGMSSKIEAQEAQKLIAEVVSVYRKEGIEAGLKKLEDKKAVWYRDYSIYRLRSKVWWEAQVLTGADDAEWSYRLFNWLHDTCESYHLGRRKIDYYYDPALLYNLSDEQIVTGRIAGLAETAQRGVEGFLRENFIDLNLSNRTPLHKGQPRLPSVDAFNNTVLRQSGSPGAGKRAGVPISYTDVFSAVVLARAKYYQGHWRETMAHSHWVRDWVSAVTDAGLENYEGSKRELWELEADVAVVDARVFENLGFYEKALDRYEVPILRNAGGYRSRHIHNSQTQQPRLRMLLGHTVEFAPAEFAELRKKREENKFEWNGAALEVDLTTANFLRSQGDVEDARALVDAVLSAATKDRLLPTRLKALEQKIDWALEDQVTDGLKESLTLALTLCREKGLKIFEPKLYHQFALLKSLEGDLAGAIELQLVAVEFYKSIDLYTWLPLRYIELAEWYLETGNLALAEHYMALALSLIKTPGSEYPEWIVARTQSRSEHLQGLLEKSRKAQNDKARIIADAGDPSASAQIEVNAVVPINIQPEYNFVMPLPEKSAMGIFTLTNFGTETREVTVQASGKIAQFLQTEGGDFEALLRASSEMSRRSLSAALPGNSQSIIYVQAAEGNAPMKLEFSIFAGQEMIDTATFESAEGGEARDASIINAAYLEDNPFYMLNILHVLQRADSSSNEAVDMRFRTTAPARIEGYDAEGNLLFVDSEGDGAFNSPGDILSADTNADGFPDLKFKENRDAVVFELLLLPHEGTAGETLELYLETRKSGLWEVDAVDTIRTK